MSQYRAPSHQRRITYGTNTEEEDRYLLCLLHKLDFNEEDAYYKLQSEIRRAPEFRFNWFLKSWTVVDLQRHFNTLITRIETEKQELQEKEKAKRKKRCPKPGIPKMSQYRAPSHQRRITYGTNTEEEDRYLLCLLHKLDFNEEDAYYKLQSEIRRAPEFRFNWFLKSWTVVDLQRHFNTLITRIETEKQELQEKEKAKRKKRCPKPGIPKMSQYRAPSHQRRITYGTNTEEEDRYLLCLLHKLDFNEEDAYYKLQSEIRRAPEFRFNWFLKSWTVVDLQRHFNTLITRIETEKQELQEKEKAKRKKRCPKPGIPKEPDSLCNDDPSSCHFSPATPKNAQHRSSKKATMKFVGTKKRNLPSPTVKLTRRKCTKKMIVKQEPDSLCNDDPTSCHFSPASPKNVCTKKKRPPSPGGRSPLPTVELTHRKCTKKMIVKPMYNPPADTAVNQENKRKAKDAKLREFFEKQFLQLKKQREIEQRTLRVSRRNRNKSEWEAEHEKEEKIMKNYAVIPSLVLGPRPKDMLFSNNNGFVKDCYKEYKDRQMLHVWTEQEKNIFREKYLQNPKNFALIASYLERKTVAACIEYYYLSKKANNYKQLLRKCSLRKKTTAVQNPPQNHQPQSMEDGQKEQQPNRRDKKGTVRSKGP